MRIDELEAMAAEQGPRWRSRKEAWLDGYLEGGMHARMTGTAPNILSRGEAKAVVKALLPAVSGTLSAELADRLGTFAFPDDDACECPESGPSELCPTHGIRYHGGPGRQQ